MKYSTIANIMCKARIQLEKSGEKNAGPKEIHFAILDTRNKDVQKYFKKLIPNKRA